MIVPPNIATLQNLITSANQILILTKESPTFDGLAASLSLYLALNAGGKKVNLCCATPTTVEFNHLVGIDKISQSLPSKNFIISLDYAEGTIEKVSYNIAGDKFNLVIEPKPGASLFSEDKVHYSSGAVSPDLLFILDCPSLEKLGKFYNENPDIFTRNVVNLDYHQENSGFGKMNFVDPMAFSVSEMMIFLLKNLGVQITQDMANNLLAGITSATDAFSSAKSGAGSFEAAAICLRAGAKRGSVNFRPTPAGSLAESSEAPSDWLKPKILKSSSNNSSTPVPSGESTTI